jgi:hypothetical protein
VTKLPALPVSIAMALFLLAGNIASAQTRTNVSELECFVAEGTGYIVGSDKDISCTLINPKGEVIEHYIGELKKYGIDIGFTRESILRWSVYVPKEYPYQPGTLAGNYTGASASAALAVGLGASVLIGGLSENYALQPLKANQQEGINIALGITRMELRSVLDTEDPEDNLDKPLDAPTQIQQ